MAIDASIISGLKAPQFESPTNALAKMLELQNAQQSNQLNSMKMDTYQRGVSDQNALSQLLGRQGFDPNSAEGRAELYRTAPTKAQDFLKANQDMRKSGSEIDKTQMESASKRIEMAGQAFGWVKDNPSAENAYAALDYLGKNGIFKPEEVAQFKGQVAANPGQVAQLATLAYQASLKAKDQLPTYQTRNTGGSTDTLGINPVTGQASVVSSVENTRSPENIANVNATMRGQNMTDARARETTTAGKIPPGYRLGGPGENELVARTGGPADLKIQGAFNQDTAALNNSTSSMDRLAVAANEAMKHPGLAGTAGLRGVIPNIPGGEAANAAALLNTLKSQVAFDVLQDMRNNSKTGGALGQVSDKEGQLLQANLAALDKSQSVEQLRASLQKIIDFSDKAKDRLRQAYNMKHGGLPTDNAGQAPSGLPNGLPPMSAIDAEIARRRGGK